MSGKLVLYCLSFKGKGDVMSCGSYREMKLLEHAMKIVEKVLEGRIQTLISLNKM